MVFLQAVMGWQSISHRKDGSTIDSVCNPPEYNPLKFVHTITQTVKFPRILSFVLLIFEDLRKTPKQKYCEGRRSVRYSCP